MIHDFVNNYNKLSKTAVLLRNNSATILSRERLVVFEQVGVCFVSGMDACGKRTQTIRSRRYFVFDQLKSKSYYYL